VVSVLLSDWSELCFLIIRLRPFSHDRSACLTDFSVVLWVGAGMVLQFSLPMVPHSPGMSARRDWKCLSRVQAGWPQQAGGLSGTYNFSKARWVDSLVLISFLFVFVMRHSLAIPVLTRRLSLSVQFIISTSAERISELLA
jgi:hypothetical protein